MASGVVDLRREDQKAYAPQEGPRIFDAGRTWCVQLTGRGDPAGPEFQDAVSTLLGLVHRIRRAARKAGHDFKMMPLECVYWTARKGVDPTAVPPESWHWRLLTRVPLFVGAKDLALAAAGLEDRREATLARAAKVKWLEEGLCVQALRVGSQGAESATLERMRAAAEARGLAFVGPRHEIQLSDPKRTAPERSKTLIRIPVARPPTARLGASPRTPA